MSKVQLTVISGAEPATYPLADYVRESVVSIGRAAENDIQLMNASVSRYHAVITENDGAYELVDMESRNGVVVNGERSFLSVLADGDVIRLGDVKLLCEVVPATRTTPRKPDPEAPA